MANDDREELKRINGRIGELEDAGSRDDLRTLLAEQNTPGGPVPVLGFRRRNGECVGAKEFLDGVAKSGPRKTEIESICFFGEHRAVVACIVEIGDARYHNVRLFVRTAGGWKLLGWANEQV